MIKLKRNLGDAAFFTPAMLIYVLFMIVPIVVTFYFSFTNWDGISESYKFVGFKNFVNLTKDKSFFGAMQTTLILTVVHVLLVNVGAIFIAIWMDKKRRVYNWSKAIIFVPAMLSPVVVSFIWSYMTQGDGGIINTILNGIGFPPVNFYGSPLATTLTVTFVISWAALGFYVTIYDAALKTIPEELYEAATVDGAGQMKQIFRITIPLLTPGLTVGLIMSLINGLRMYDFVKIMTPKSISTVAVNAVDRMTEYNMMGYACAIVLVLFLATVLVSCLQLFLMKKKEVKY